MSVRILLVDDVPDVRRLVRIALRYHGGFDVVGEARAGVQAIEMATELHPDVVLLDLGLPDLAGREVLTRLREVAPMAKVVVFTGRDEVDRPYFEEHAAGFVTKGGELDHLLSLLDDLTHSAEHEATADFAADVACVPQAREFVRQRLEEWDADPFKEEASLVVTELATNAVLHAGSPFRVRLSIVSGLLRIEVSDDDLGTPEPQPFSATAEHGRGIVLVSAVSASWGIDALPGQGKVTWAELSPA